MPYAMLRIIGKNWRDLQSKIKSKKGQGKRPVLSFKLSRQVCKKNWRFFKHGWVYRKTIKSLFLLYPTYFISIYILNSLKRNCTYTYKLFIRILRMFRIYFSYITYTICICIRIFPFSSNRDINREINTSSSFNHQRFHHLK